MHHALFLLFCFDVVLVVVVVVVVVVIIVARVSKVISSGYTISRTFQI